MKALRLFILVSMVVFSNWSYGQLDLRNDNYILRSDIGLNYYLRVLNNDTPNINLIKITSVVRLGSSASLYTSGVIDSSFVLIASASPDTFSGSLQYKGINNLGQIDSAIITFTRQVISPSVRPGDANNDNLVNHFDIFPIGLLYNRRGDSRHNSDTNIEFNVPKRIADWTFGVNNLNGKFADIDGNSVINQTDFEKLKLNLGQSAGTYSPKLSDTIGSNLMRLDFKDTIEVSSIDSGKIRVPIKLVSPNSILSYGLGFSISMRNKMENTTQDTFFHRYKYLQPSTESLWQGPSGKDILFIEDKNSRPNHTNLAYSRKDGKNDNIDSDLGVVEIIVDEILLGKVDKTKYSRILLSISDLALIDNSYNTIPVKPVSKYVYFKSNTASISNPDQSILLVYPTLIQSGFTILSDDKKPINFTIYNAIGQSVYNSTLQEDETKISTSNWSNGLYYLKLVDSEKVYKLVKQ